jgi:hypothetical protein
VQWLRFFKGVEERRESTPHLENQLPAAPVKVLGSRHKYGAPVKRLGSCRSCTGAIQREAENPKKLGDGWYCGRS